MTASKDGVSSAAFQPRTLSDVELVKLEPGLIQQPGQPPMLQTDIIGVVEAVDPCDIVPGIEQQLAHPRADEPRKPVTRII